VTADSPSARIPSGGFAIVLDLHAPALETSGNDGSRNPRGVTCVSARTRSNNSPGRPAGRTLSKPISGAARRALPFRTVSRHSGRFPESTGTGSRDGAVLPS